MKKIFFFSCVFFISVGKGAAQDTAPSDSAAKNEVEKRWGFDFRLDQRTSFINDQNYNGSPVTINGITMGWTYKHRFRIGWGGYFVNTQRNKAYFINYTPQIASLAPNATPLPSKTNPKTYLVQNKVQMYYITPSFEFIYFKSKWLDLSVPLEIGVGYSKLTVTDYFTDTQMPIFNKKGEVISAEDIFFPALAAFACMVNLSPDVGLSASLGYRTILKEIGISPNFDGMFYQIGLQLFPDNIKKNMKKDYREWKEERKKRKQEKRNKKKVTE